ncbi:MAG: flagellar basal body protein [Alphaproteobacteria bacterium]|nr:flagellar basal body protein [Alphaproteobacteria bacterium]
MTAQDLPLMDAAIRKMRWHETRQRVLAQNIANADTAGYQAQDTVPLDFSNLLEGSANQHSLSLATTDSKHLGLDGASGFAGQPVIKTEKKFFDSSGSSNAISVEEQLLKMNESYTDHRLAAAIYQKNVDMLKRAARSQ